MTASFLTHSEDNAYLNQSDENLIRELRHIILDTEPIDIDRIHSIVSELNKRGYGPSDQDAMNALISFWSTLT